MGRVIASEFVTLDGVMEAPGHDQHRDGKNAWALRRQTTETQQFIRDAFDDTGALLLGRTTYQIWAAFWPTADQDDEFTRRITAMPKYMVRFLKSSASTGAFL